MYKLFILAAFLTIVAARPSHFESAPLVYAAPAAAAAYIEEPTYAKVGAVVKSIPTAVSHQSQSIVHSSAQVVEPIVAPVIKSYAAAPVIKTYASPLVHSYAPAATVATGVQHYSAAPLVHSYAAAVPAPVYKSYAAAPVTYAAASPLSYAAAPLSYAAAPLSYAAPAHYSAW